MRKFLSVLSILLCLGVLLLVAADYLHPEMLIYSNHIVKYFTCLACLAVWFNCIGYVRNARKKRRRELARREKARRRGA